MIDNNQNQSQPFITPKDAMSEEKNENAQPDDNAVDDEFAQTQNQLRQISLSEKGWGKELHQQMNEIRGLADSPKASTDDGAATMELLMRNLGMPSVTFSGKALDMLDKREEAMFEERGLRAQGKSYQALDGKGKEGAEARAYNGVLFRNDWRRLYDFNKNTNSQFSTQPATPATKAAQTALQTIIENEIRLAAVRDPSLGLDFNDNEKVKEIADRIMNDVEFIKMLNQEKSTSPNVTNIKFEIIKRIKPENETEGNLPAGS